MEENDLKQLIEKLCNHAVVLLEKDGQLNPLALIINSEGGITPCSLPWENDEEKGKLLLVLGVSLKKFDSHEVIFLSDVAMRSIGTDDPKETRKMKEYYKENHATEQPLSYPKSMREDGIYLQYMDLNLNHTKAYFKRYEDRENEPRFYHELKCIDKGAKSMGGLIIEQISYGYENAEEIIKKIKELPGMPENFPGMPDDFLGERME